MSQQEMQFDNTRHSQDRSYDSGYEASPHYSNDDEASPYYQKITGQGEEKARESAHLREHMLNLRMGMAITSLVLWMAFFLIAIAIIAGNPASGILQLFTFIGMGVFTVFVVLANFLINRKQI